MIRRERALYHAVRAHDQPLCWIVLHDSEAQKLQRAQREPATSDGICICFSRGAGERIAAALNLRVTTLAARRQRRLA